MGNETKKLGTEIDVLKKRIEYLEKILDQAGIPYDVEQNSEPKAEDNSVEADNLMPYIIPETITPTISIHSSRAELMSIARDQESRIPKPERQDITHNVGTIGKMVYAQNARVSR